MARSLRLGRAAVEAGSGHMLGRLGLRRSSRGDAEPGRILVSALLELRGAAFKVAQFLALEDDLLKDPVARELVGCGHRTPPIGPELARHLLGSEVGPIEGHFTSFDPVPFAAASLGQVHAAVTRDGLEVAVKIQYPGIEETVRSDLRLLRRAVGMFPQGIHYAHLLAEVETRLLEECDYEQEAEGLAWFAERIDLEGVAIPKPFPALSGPTVLTTERLAGRDLDAWLRTRPCQSERDRAAQRLYDVFAQSLHLHGRIHADPNPANFRFESDGRIGVLDFGCTRWIPPDCESLIRRVWRSAIADDDEAAHRVYLDMGLFAHLSAEDAREVDRTSLKPFRDWLAIPFRAERHDFGADPEFVTEGRRRFFRMLRDNALVGIRPEFVLVNRTLYGLYRIFGRLRARVRCRTSWTSG